MNRTAHYFYAIRLPGDVKQRLKELCDRLKKEFPFERWVYQEDYHITLAFLGFAPDDQLQMSLQLIQEELLQEHEFILHIESLGVFGRNDSPRIFWADLQKVDRLHEVRDIVFKACKQAGFQLEKRPFRPHITLARKWSGTSPLSKEQLISQAQEKITFTADEVVLYKTHLDRVPKYEAVKIISLKSN